METETILFLFGLGATIVGGMFKTLRDDIKEVRRELREASTDRRNLSERIGQVEREYEDERKWEI